MVAAALLRKAKRGTLEVEDLLAAARSPSPSLAGEIDGLIAELHWRELSALPEVPWFEWATTVRTFCLNGFAGLNDLASDARYLPFVVGLIEELRDPEALAALIRLLPRYHVSTNAIEAHRIAAGLNLLGMRSRHLDLDAIDEARIRVFLHDVLEGSENEAAWGTALCALRYFGDRSSLGLIASVPAMSDAWERARAAASRAVKQRSKH